MRRARNIRMYDEVRPIWLCNRTTTKSIDETNTIVPSKTFHLSCQYALQPSAASFSPISAMKMSVIAVDIASSMTP
eukprot:3621419-Prymnesium_polylepis.3